MVIAGSILVAGIAIGAGLYLSRTESPPPSSQGEQRGRDELILTGTVVVDGTTNGCAGENILVEVRESFGNVVSESIPSDFVGLDCAFPFALEVPRLDCYQLVISETVVDDYPREALELGASQESWTSGTSIPRASSENQGHSRSRDLATGRMGALTVADVDTPTARELGEPGFEDLLGSRLRLCSRGRTRPPLDSSESRQARAGRRFRYKNAGRGACQV